MKRLLIAILLSSMVQGIFAQKIEIKGTIRNTTDNEAVEFVNVVLQTIDSTFVSGVSTNNNGNFIFNKIDAGDYRLVLSSIGYNTQYVTLNGVKRNTDLGDIHMEDAAVALEGVTINGSNQISRPDRKLVFPSERQMKVSTNGVNLLQELMLPRIQVNPMNNEIGISGGGELQIRINGAKADINEIKALRPADIIRIEYHDNPGLRYGNAEIVLDYIVRRPDTGGSFGTDLSQGVNAMWGNYNVFGKVNHKKSEFGLSYYMGPRDFYGMYRDNEETFRLADGSTIQRMEKGEPSHAMLFMQNLNVNYSLQASQNSLFSATFRLRGNNQPNWDYQGVLYNVNDETDMVNMIDRTKNSWTRPSLDLYFQQSLKNKQTLVFNLVGTYNREKSHRIYQESLHDEMLTDINNDVLGDKYSLIGEAIYEKQFSKGNALSFGLQHTQSYSNNEYRNGHNYDTRMNQGNSYIFSEYRGKINKLDYRLGISLTRFYYNQSGIIYGYETDGLFVDQAEIDAAPEQLVGKSSLKPGYVKYKDISGPDGVPDGKVDAQYDRTVLGSTTPKFYYGLNLSASYKGLDFSALLQGLGGHKRLIGSYMAYAFYNGGQIQRWQADNCWTEANSNKWAEYPRLETLNMNNTNLQTSDYWVRNASFLRVKNVQIGYTFPKTWTKKIGMENVRVYVSGQNLFSFNSFYKGWDPENEIATGDGPSYYPINSIYSFGFNIKF